MQLEADAVRPDLASPEPAVGDHPVQRVVAVGAPQEQQAEGPPGQEGDLAGSAKGDEDKTRNLVQAASRAGVRHLVYISVVGADRIPIVSGIDRAMFGYFGSKLAAERIVSDSGIPWTTLRATQFHDLQLTVAEQMARLPVIPVPSGVRFQPIDADEVAARLVELTLGKPAGLVPDMAGPRVYGMADLIRGYLRARDKRRLLVPVWLPGKAACAMRQARTCLPNEPWGSGPGRTS